MAATFSLTFLGTGTSVGVPVIGCDCRTCTSANPRDQRCRSSVLIRAGETTVLVDSGPDLRIQALREGLREIDAVIYTHPHVDHVVGFDELRAFCWRRDVPLPLHATASCMKVLQNMFGWAFFPEAINEGYVKPAPRLIDGPFYYGDLKITPLPVQHAAVETIGFLFEFGRARKVAYIPDVKFIPEDTARMIYQVDVLILDALRHQPHPTHFSLSEALAAIEEIKPRESWLTHLTHDYHVEEVSKTLPPHVQMAWDGLKLELS